MSTSGATVHVVEFEFSTKNECAIEAKDIFGAIEAGKSVWIDIDFDDPIIALPEILELDLFNTDIIENALNEPPSTQCLRFPSCIQMIMTSSEFVDGKLQFNRVDVIVMEKLIATIHHGPVRFIDSVRREYRDDFVHHAKSLSFMVYEIWDHLIESSVDIQHQLEDRVQELRSTLIGEASQDVFGEVSALGSDLLHFRKALLPARSVLTELSTRKSRFISEDTQPFLLNMVGLLENVLQDLMVDRDILSESLNLYVSIVGHRTNIVMRKLTVVSVVFLPLTFLCGVYGMNFEHFPEIGWRHGYLYFWALVALIVTGLLGFMKRNDLL